MDEQKIPQGPDVLATRHIRQPITEFPLFMEMILEGWARRIVNNCLAWALLRMKRTRGIDIYMHAKGGHKHVRRRMLRTLRAMQ